MDAQHQQPFAFVLMPFNDEWKDLYELGIKPACEAVRVGCAVAVAASAQSESGHPPLLPDRGTGSNAFTYTFRLERKRVLDPTTTPSSWTVEMVEPTGTVSAPDYEEAPLPFTFVGQDEDVSTMPLRPDVANVDPVKPPARPSPGLRDRGPRTPRRFHQRGVRSLPEGRAPCRHPRGRG